MESVVRQGASITETMIIFAANPGYILKKRFFKKLPGCGSDSQLFVIK
jgi:hypothetical protein